MSEQVEIKILRNVGTYTTGQILSVPSELAEALCAKRTRTDGHGLIHWQNAIKTADLEAFKKLPFEQTQLTIDEARELGIVNIAVDPKGPGDILPERLKVSSEEPGFSESKSENEFKSAKQSVEHNEKRKGGK